MPEVIVAVVHDGQVLTDGARGLPTVTVERGVSTFAPVLAAVGADILLGPVLRASDSHRLMVAGCRAVAPPDGTWADPAALADEALGGLVARTVAEHHGDAPPLRPAWFRAGWYDRVEAWVDASLARVGRRRTGPMEVSRVWSISAVLRIPTERGDVWFKAPCEHFRGEPAVHRVLAAHFPDLVPTLVAEDDELAFLLMDPLAGTDGDRADGGGPVLAEAWSSAQLASLEHRTEMLTHGCTLRDAEHLVAGYRQVLADSAELAHLSQADLDAVRAVQDEVEVAVHELWSCGLPDTVSHGDLHLGNVAWDGRELRIFDWTDGCWTHPLLDAAHVSHFDSSNPPDLGLYGAFARTWRRAFPDADVDRALELAPLVDLVFQCDTFDRIARATEPASSYELGGVTASLLRAIPKQLAALSS